MLVESREYESKFLNQGVNSLAMTGETAQEEVKQGEITINGRFGEVMVDTNNSVFFPHGLLGLADNLHFAVADFPNPMGQFKLFQCLNDKDLSFIVLPLSIDNTLISRADVEESAKVLNIDLKNILMLLIVSIKRTPAGTEVTANVRAPIMIDTKDKAGIQYVFPHNRYDIRTKLDGA